MEYVNLGSTGLRVSRVCLGMMSFGPHESRRGRSTRRRPSRSSGAPSRAGSPSSTPPTSTTAARARSSPAACSRSCSTREEYVVATKVHGQTMPGENGRGLSRKHVLASIDASLGRLGLDYVDLYQIHRWDPTTPIEETMEALHDVVKAGKARYIGASSMYAWQFAKAQARQSAAADAVRLDAEPLQPRLPRGGAGDDPAVRRPGRRRAPRGARSRAGSWPATARARASASRRAPDATRSATRSTARGRLRRRRPRRPRSRPRAACRARRSRSPGSSPSRA